jgi:hypothetical protein
VSKQNDFSVAKAAPGAATRMLAARVLAGVHPWPLAEAELAWALPSWPTVVTGLLEALCLQCCAAAAYHRRGLAVVDAEAAVGA